MNTARILAVCVAFLTLALGRAATPKTVTADSTSAEILWPTNFFSANSNLLVTAGGVVPIERGGSGQATVALARTAWGLDQGAPGATGTNLLVAATPGAARVILGLDSGVPGAVGTNLLVSATGAAARSILGFDQADPGAFGTNLVVLATAAEARVLLGLDAGAPTLIGTNMLTVASASAAQSLIDAVARSSGSATNLSVYVSGKGGGNDFELRGPTWTNYWSWSYNNDGSFMWPKILGYGGAEVAVTNIADYDVLNWGTAYRKLPPVVSSVSQMESFSDSAPLVLLADTNIGGLFMASTAALPVDSGNVFTNTGMARVWVRTQTDRIVNVRHFGAIGDGTTDDTAAIQLAVTAAAAQKNRGVATLYFPQGTYYCTSGFDARDMHIRMDGTILSSSNLTTSQLLIGQNTLPPGNPSLTFDLRLRMNGGAGFNADPDGIKTNVIAVESRYLAVSKVTLDIEGYPVGFKVASEDGACTYNQTYATKIRNSDICIWLKSSATYGNFDSWWYLNRVIAGNATHAANANSSDGRWGQACIFTEVPAGSAYSVYQHNFVGGLMELVGYARGFFKTAGGIGGKIKIIGTHVEASLVGGAKPEFLHTILTAAGGRARNTATTIELEDIDVFDEDCEYMHAGGGTTHGLQLIFSPKRVPYEYLRENSTFDGRTVNDLVQNESSTAVYSQLINFYNDSGNRMTPAMGSSSYRLQNWGNGTYATESSLTGSPFLQNIGGLPGIRFTQEGPLPSVIKVTGGGTMRANFWCWDGSGVNLNATTNYWPVWGGTMSSTTNGSGIFFTAHTFSSQSDIVVTPRVKQGLIIFSPRGLGETFFSLPKLEVVQGSLTFDWPGNNPANCNKPSVMTAPYTKRLWFPGQTWLSPEGQLWTVTNGGDTTVASTNSTTQIVVASATGIANGDYICIETDNDFILQETTPRTVQTVQDRHFGQITGLSGTTVTFTPAVTNTMAVGRRVWTWAWTSKVEPSLLSTKDTAIRNSMDDSVERLSATAAAFNPTGWTIAGSAVTTNGTTYAVTNSSGTCSLTHTLSGSPLRANTHWTLALTFAGAAVVDTNNTVAVQLGGTQIGTIVNADSGTKTFTGVRTAAANQNVVITTTYASGTNTQFELETATLTTYASADVSMPHLITAATYTPSASAAPYFTFSAGGTHAANGNSKPKVLTLAGATVTQVPEVLTTLTSSDNGGDWFMEGKVYATGASTYALEVFYTDPTTTLRDSVPITTLTSGFTWAGGGYFGIGSNADGADADVVFRTSSVKGQQ